MGNASGPWRVPGTVNVEVGEKEENVTGCHHNGGDHTSTLPVCVCVGEQSAFCKGSTENHRQMFSSILPTS